MAELLPSGELIEEPSDYGSMQPGTRLGRYELLVPIARGGMARVWAARLHGQRGFQKLVAIKTILPHLAEEPEFERMFLDEARIASGVHHPNVCEIYELGEEKKTLYLVMEWVSGDSLARVLRASGKTEALDPRVVARVMADACAGLHAAHELTDEDGRALGVVHRDLSPHNILLTADGTAKVADFGVAKALGQLHEATSAGQLKGKIAYMAPEQVTGQGVDRRSDVFSLGCVLYEATTGQRPFRGDGDHQVMHAVLKGEFPAPTSLIRGYPQELERVVMRALSPQPILRYPTAERLRFALEELLARGQLVTQSNVAQVVRARIGENIDRRKERIRVASTAGDREGGWSEPPGNMTPSGQAAEHRSGVKQSAAGHAARPLFTTMQMDRPRSGPSTVAPLTPPMVPTMPPPLPVLGGPVGPASSTTIPHAPAYPAGTGEGGENARSRHTPVSHPGAAYSKPGGPNPFAQTALMPPDMASMPNTPAGASPGGPPPNTQQLRPFTLPPTSPPHMPPQQMQQMHEQQLQQLQMQQMHEQQQMQQQQVQQQQMHEQQVQQQQMHEQQMQQPGTGFSQLSPVSNPFGPTSVPSGGSYDPLAPQSDPAGSSPPAGAGQYAVAIAAGVLVAVLIGLGGFYAWRGKQTPAAAEPATTATAKAVVSAAPGTGAGAGAGAPTPVSANILFKIVPSDATLSVDGVELSGNARTLERPPMGKTVTVMARAKGHEEITIFVDFFTTSPMELTLKPVGEAGAGPADAAPQVSATGAVGATGTTGATTGSPTGGAATAEEPKDPPKDPPKKRLPPKGDPALPPNPF